MKEVAQGDKFRSVRELIDAYVAHLQQRSSKPGRSSEALENAIRVLKLFAKWKGRELVANCDRDDLGEFLKRNPTWKSDHTKKTSLSFVIRAFRWAWDNRKIDSYYYSTKDIPLSPKPKRAATRREYRLLLENGDRQFRRALYFLWHTAA